MQRMTAPSEIQSLVCCVALYYFSSEQFEEFPGGARFCALSMLRFPDFELRRSFGSIFRNPGTRCSRLV